MYLYKRRNKWWIEFTVDGERHRVSTHAEKKADAVLFAQSIDTARHAPTLEDAINVLRTIYRAPHAEGLKLADMWGTYERIATAVGKLSVTDHTKRVRKYRVEDFVEWAQKNAATIKTVDAVDGRIALLYVQHLAAEGGKTKTRRNIIGDLSAVWRILEKASPDIRNPWDNLAPADTDGERGEPFTREQEAAVLKAAKGIGKGWFEICTLARHTGLRYGSCAFLEWDDVHFDTNTIETEPSKTKRFGIYVAIPISKPLMAVLKKIPKGGDYVFPIHAHMYGRVTDELKFREVLDAAGVSGSGFTFQSWRHTFRTRLAESGADIETAMRLCGHTQKSTSRRYDHFKYVEQMRKAIDAAAK